MYIYIFCCYPCINHVLCTYPSTLLFPCARFSSARSPFPVPLNCRQSSGAYGAETEAVTSCSTLSLTHPPRGEQLFHRHRRRRTDWLAGAGADCCKYRICARFCGITVVKPRVMRGNCEGIMMSQFDWYIVSAERRNVTKHTGTGFAEEQLRCLEYGGAGVKQFNSLDLPDSALWREGSLGTLCRRARGLRRGVAWRMAFFVVSCPRHCGSYSGNGKVVRMSSLTKHRLSSSNRQSCIFRHGLRKEMDKECQALR